MNALVDACREIVSNAPEALGCGVVDLNTGMLLGSYITSPHFTPKFLDTLAAAALDMFRGKNIRRIERLLTKQKGRVVKDTFQEIQVTSLHTHHFMKRLPSEDALVILITHTTSNLGMGWATLRSAVVDIEAVMKQME